MSLQYRCIIIQEEIDCQELINIKSLITDNIGLLLYNVDTFLIILL